MERKNYQVTAIIVAIDKSTFEGQNAIVFASQNNDFKGIDEEGNDVAKSLFSVNTRRLQTLLSDALANYANKNKTTAVLSMAVATAGIFNTISKDILAMTLLNSQITFTFEQVFKGESLEYGEGVYSNDAYRLKNIELVSIVDDDFIAMTLLSMRDLWHEKNQKTTIAKPVVTIK